MTRINTEAQRRRAHSRFAIHDSRFSAAAALSGFSGPRRVGSGTRADHGIRPFASPSHLCDRESAISSVPPRLVVHPADQRQPPLRVAWLTTGQRGPGSRALEYLIPGHRGRLPVEIAVVFISFVTAAVKATDRLIDMLEASAIRVETMSSVAFLSALWRQGRPGDRSSRASNPTRRGSRERSLHGYDFTLGVMFVCSSPPSRSMQVHIH